jgi:hypothetical protein
MWQYFLFVRSASVRMHYMLIFSSAIIRYVHSLLLPLLTPFVCQCFQRVHFVFCLLYFCFYIVACPLRAGIVNQQRRLLRGNNSVNVLIWLSGNVTTATLTCNRGPRHVRFCNDVTWQRRNCGKDVFCWFRTEVVSWESKQDRPSI